MKTKKDKGSELEKAFEKYMQRELGYYFTERNILVNGKTAVRPYEIDIHGKILNKFFVWLQKIGFFFVIFSVLELFFSFFPVIDKFLEKLFTDISPQLAGSALFILAFAGFIMGFIGKNNSIKHTWVECKNLKSNVKRTHVQKLVAAVDDHNDYVKDQKDTKSEWETDEMILVSAKDFDIDAKNFAKKHIIQCYVWKGKNKLTLVLDPTRD